MMFLRSYTDPSLAKASHTQKCEKSEIHRERTNDVAPKCADESSCQNAPSKTRASEILRLKAKNRSFRRKGDMKLRQLLSRSEMRYTCSILESLTPRVKFPGIQKLQSLQELHKRIQSQHCSRSIAFLSLTLFEVFSAQNQNHF
jgi:hypothetical protein